MKDYLETLHEDSLKEPGYAEAWEPYRIMLALLDERRRLGLSQAEVAEKMGTSQVAIARMENNPTKASFERVILYAAAVGATLSVAAGNLEPKAEPETRGRKPNRSKSAKAVTAA